MGAASGQRGVYLNSYGTLFPLTCTYVVDISVAMNWRNLIATMAIPAVCGYGDMAKGGVKSPCVHHLEDLGGLRDDSRIDTYLSAASPAEGQEFSGARVPSSKFKVRVGVREGATFRLRTEQVDFIDETSRRGGRGERCVFVNMGSESIERAGKAILVWQAIQAFLASGEPVSLAQLAGFLRAKYGGEVAVEWVTTSTCSPDAPVVTALLVSVRQSDENHHKGHPKDSDRETPTPRQAGSPAATPLKE